MRVTIRVDGGGRGDGAQDKELAGYLGDQQGLRGRVHLIAERRQAGGLNQSIATIVADLGPAGLAAFGSALIAWIRHRTADTRVILRRPDGARFEVSAQRVRGLGAAEMRSLVEQIAKAVSEPPQAP